MNAKMVAAAIAAMTGALAGFGDSFTWKGGAGAWNDVSSWLDATAGGGGAERIPADGDSVNVATDATITFPTDVAETKFVGAFTIEGVSPDDAAGTTRSVVLDSRGTSFFYTNSTASILHPIVTSYAWTYKNAHYDWLTGGNAIYIYKSSGGDKTYPGTLLAKDALLEFTLSPTNTTLVQKQGLVRSAAENAASRPFFLCGAAGGGTTNWTEFVVEKGDFDGGLKLLGYSRFVFKSAGNFTCSPSLLPNADNTGDGYGGGPAELVMSAGTNRTNYGALTVGAFGGADAKFTACGTAFIERYGTGTGSSVDLSVVSQAANNSALGTARRGEATFADSAVYHVWGRNDASQQYGNINIATVTNATGVVTVQDDAQVLFDRGYAKVGTGDNASGYLTVKGRGILKALGAAGTKLAAANLGITLGGALSVESVLTISDDALVETPRVAATTASANAEFVRNALVLDGGTLATAKIEGEALDVTVDDATIRASAATTADAPLLAANGVKSMTATGAKTLTIDTQAFDTYIDYSFPRDLMIVKKGSGTLYVKSSSHAKTIIAEGAISMTDDGAFGAACEMDADLEIPVPSVAETSDVVFMTFARQKDANAYATAFNEHVARQSGYAVGDVTVVQSGEEVWQVKATVTVKAAGDAKTWAGAAGAMWATSASWSPAGVPEPDDAVTVSGDAAIEMPRYGYAKTLSLPELGTLSLAGGTSALAIDEVIVKGDKSSKTYHVAEGANVTIATPKFTTEDVGFKKTGPGALTLDLRAKPSLTFIASNATDKIRIDEGALNVVGSGTARESSSHLQNEITCFYGDTYVGGADTPANGAVALTLDNAGFGRPDITDRASGGGGGSLYVGSFSGNATGATATLSLVDQSIVCANGIEVGYRPTAADTTSILGVTNSTIVLIPSQALGLGYAESDAEATSGMSVVARFGEGAVVKDTGGGNCNGALRFGCGLDVAFEDGAKVELSQVSNEKYACGWATSYSRAFGDVRFARGSSLKFTGGLLFNNCQTPDLSETRRLQITFDGGTLIPAIPDASDERSAWKECRAALFYKPEHQGFAAGADGMFVDMSSCSRYMIAAPVRGEGALVKTGAGTLVLGKGRMPAAKYTEAGFVTEASFADETKVVESGVVTVQNAGGVRIAEGTVELEAGATDTNSTFEVAADCTLDLAGSTVALGAVKGAGMVEDGTISTFVMKPLADGEEAATLKDVAVGKAFVDFGGAADKKTAVRLVRLGTGVTGALSKGTTFRVKAFNTGDAELRYAQCAVDADGLVTATATTSPGLIFIVR